MGRWSSKRWPPGPPSAATVPLSAGGAEAEKQRGGRHWLDLFVNSEKFRGPTVKQKYLLNLGSNEKVPNMKVVQFFKIYNFDIVQKLI